MVLRLLLLGWFFISPCVHLLAQESVTPVQRLEQKLAEWRSEHATDPIRRKEAWELRLALAGGKSQAQAARLWSKFRSPLDALDADKIPADQRKFLSIPDLAGFFEAHPRAASSLAISLDGSRLATAGWDNTVKLWKLGNATVQSWATLDASPSQVAFSPDGNTLITGAADTAIQVWDISGETPKRKFTMAGHKTRPFSSAFSPNGKMLATGSFQPTLRLWKIDAGEFEAWGVLANETATAVGVHSMAFSHDGQWLATGNHVGKNTLRWWRVDGAFLDEKPAPEVQARLLTFSPTTPHLAFADKDNTVYLWNYETSPAKEKKALLGHRGQGFGPIVKSLAFDPLGRFLLSSGSDRQVILWDVATAKQLQQWDLLDEVRAAAFASDGRHVVLGNDDGTVYVFRLKK